MVYEYGYMGMYSIQLTPWNIMIPFKYYVLGLAFKYQSEQERMNIHDEQWGIETCHHRIPGYIRIDLFVQCFLLLYFYKNDALRNIFDVINFTFFIINQHDHFKQCRTIAQVYICDFKHAAVSEKIIPSVKLVNGAIVKFDDFIRLPFCLAFQFDDCFVVLSSRLHYRMIDISSSKKSPREMWKRFTFQNQRAINLSLFTCIRWTYPQSGLHVMDIRLLGLCINPNLVHRFWQYDDSRLTVRIYFFSWLSIIFYISGDYYDYERL